jgi:hypothetical protein
MTLIVSIASEISRRGVCQCPNTIFGDSRTNHTIRVPLALENAYEADTLGSSGHRRGTDQAMQLFRETSPWHCRPRDIAPSTSRRRSSRFPKFSNASLSRHPDGQSIMSFKPGLDLDGNASGSGPHWALHLMRPMQSWQAQSRTSAFQS